MAHDIHDFVRQSQEELQAEYVRIQKRATEDPGTAGDQGEENWATLLRKWLPQYFHVVTKGRILTDSGYASPQIDVLVLYPSYPRILLDKKLYLSGGVAAAFECKTTLTAAHVTKAVETSAELKAALPERQGSPYKELHAGILYGLLAHSHRWQGAKSKPIANIGNALWRADENAVKHPRECIDMIVVSDLAFWKVMKLTYIGPALAGYSDVMRETYGSDGCATSGYACGVLGSKDQEDYYSPIGAMLSSIYSSLSWVFPDMRQLEEYFRKVNLLGRGKGYSRIWDLDIYSPKVREGVCQGKTSKGGAYDEWPLSF